MTATSVANSANSASASIAVTDLAGVFTHHNDLSRDGTNTQEYALTPATRKHHYFWKAVLLRGGWRSFHATALGSELEHSRRDS